MYDNDLVSKDDLIINNFTKKEDINKYTLAQATQRGLMELNNSSIIMTFKSDLFENIELLKDFNIVIITNIIPLKKAEILNDYCRKEHKGFIYSCQIGLVFFLFEDFGDNFMINDKNGKKCKKYFIKTITNACPGIVEIDPIEIVEEKKKKKKYLQLETGDYVVFKGVSGMSELNDSPPRPIRVLSKNKFTIEETSRYDVFTGLGIVEEMKIPFPLKFIPLTKAKKMIYFDDFNDNDVDSNNKIIDEKVFDIEYDEMIDNEIKNQFVDNLSWMNIFNSKNKNETLINNSNAKIHLAIAAIHEYYSIHKYLPKYTEQQAIKDCIDISSRIFSKAKQENEKWVENLNDIDIKYITNIFKFCGFFFIPAIKFFGGVLSQEILKYIGLYKPVHQWVYFNFFEFMNDEISLIDTEQLLKDSNIKQDIEQYMTCDKEKITILKNINIVIIGFNDIGFEILNLFMNLNLFKNITILDINKGGNYIKICRLKEIYDFKIFVENNIVNDLSDKAWWKDSKILIDTLSYKYNKKEKDLLITNSNKFNKILIDVNANKSYASLDMILPEKLSKKKNINYPLEDMNTPGGENIKNDQINNYQDELKYTNIQNLKESLHFSKKIFENYFYLDIIHLNELIKRFNSEEEILKYIDDLMQKENNNEKILKLIRYLKKLVSVKFGISFEAIVLMACEIFQELFQFSIDEILFQYPEDYIELGKLKKFWSGKKYPPKAILFDINDEEHFQILYLITYFLCQILELKDFENKMNDIKSIAKKYELKKYDSSIQTRAKDATFFNMEKNSLVRFLTLYGKENKFEFKEIKLDIENNEDINDFSKLNKHLKFIILASNLILKIYGIKTHNNIYKDISFLFKMDTIFPSIVSSISGLVLIQLLTMINDTDFDEFLSSLEEQINEIKEENIKIKNNNKNSVIFKNANINLGMNIYLFYNNFKNK